MDEPEVTKRFSVLTGDSETLEPEDGAEVRLILAAIDEVVFAAGEDFEYQRKLTPGMAKLEGSCLYVWEGQADCLAGRVLAQLGMPLADMARYEGFPCDAMSATSVNGSDRPKAPVGLYALATLRAAQSRQDRGERWGDARDAAHRWAKDCYGIEV